MTTGLVVAGGYSTRFGLAEKALARVDGEPMLRRVADAVAPLVEEVVVDCRDGQRPAFATALAGVDCPVAFATDDVPDGGPVAGLATGLEVVPDGAVLVCSCDRPHLTPGLLEACLLALADGGPDAVVPEVDGHPQPLCGAYDGAALRRAVGAVRRDGDRRLLAVLSALDVERRPPSRLPIDDASALRSVDTPLELGLAGRHPADVQRTGRPDPQRSGSAPAEPATAPQRRQPIGE